MDYVGIGKKKTELDKDYIFGRWGPYQTLQAAFVFFHTWETGFQLLVGVFIAYRPGFQCATPYFDNISLSNDSSYVLYGKCQIKVFHNDTDGPKLDSVRECTSDYKYTLDKEKTIVTEFDLVCDNSNLAEFLQTLVMAGQLVGAVCASSLSDRVGRKTVHLCSNLLTLIFGISVAFAPNYTTLAILKFILGVLQQGMVMSGAVFTVELFPEKTRYLSKLAGSFMFTTGLVLMSAIAYLLRSYPWRYLQITLSCFSLLSLIQYWITNTLTYFGLLLTATSLAGNHFLNFFLSACVEYISFILEVFMLYRFGRRTALMFFHCITGTSLALATLLNYFSDGNETLILLSVIATFAGKMSVTGSFSTLFLFTPELYPTNLRNVGIGICSTFSRIGAMISPFVGILASHIPWAPGTIFVSMCFIVIIIALYLPETREMDLLQTLGEVKIWYAGNIGFRLKKGRKKNKSAPEILDHCDS